MLRSACYYSCCVLFFCGILCVSVQSVYAESGAQIVWDYNGRYVVRAQCQQQDFLLDIHRERNSCSIRASNMQQSVSIRARGRARRGVLQFSFASDFTDSLAHNKATQSWTLESSGNKLYGFRRLGAHEAQSVAYNLVARYEHSSQYSTARYHSDSWLPVIMIQGKEGVAALNEQMRVSQKESHATFLKLCDQGFRTHPLRHHDEIVIRWLSGSLLSVQRYVHSALSEDHTQSWYDCATYRIDQQQPVRLQWSDLVVDVDQHWDVINEVIIKALHEKGASMYAAEGFRMHELPNVLRAGNDVIVYVAAITEGQRQQGPYAITVSAQQLEARAIRLQTLK